MYRDLYRRPQHRRSGIDPIGYFPFYYTGSRKNNDRFGWPIEDLSSNVVLDWAAVDGNMPNVGPELTATGAINNIAAPFDDAFDNDIVAAKFDGEKYSTTSNVPVFLDTDDVYGMALVRPDPIDLSGNKVIFCIGRGDAWYNSVYLRWISNGIRLYVRGNGSVLVISTLTNALYTSNAWYVVQFLIEKNGNQAIWLNETKSSDSATPPGSINDEETLSISGVQSNNGINMFGQIARLILCAGNGIASIVSADSYEYIGKMFSHVSGIANIKNGSVSSFSRNSVAGAIKGSKIFIYGYGMPSSGREGIKIHNDLINECYRNINPSTAAGWTATGGMPINVIADDSTDLESAGSVDCSEFGPAVFELDNTGGGSTQYAYNGAATGDTSKRSLQIRGKHVTGSSGFQLGFYDSVGASFSNGVEINDNYEITTNKNIVPVITDYLAVAVPAGQKIYVIAQQMEAKINCSDCVPNFATGSTTAVDQDEVDTNIPSDQTLMSLTFSLNVEDGFTGGETRYILNGALYIRYNQNFLTMIDGTNTLASTVEVTDGAWHEVLMSWGPSGMKLQVDDEIVTGPFDGIIYGFGGSVKVGSFGSDPGGFIVKDLRVYGVEQ